MSMKQDVQFANAVWPEVCWQYLPKKRCQDETRQNMSNQLCCTIYMDCNTNDTDTDFHLVLFDLHFDLQVFRLVFIEFIKCQMVSRLSQ